MFLKAHILSKGLVLADLPGKQARSTSVLVLCSPCLTHFLTGLRDHNSARRNITERYIINCNEIFVVCNIGRAVTDEGVEHVIKLARQAKLSNVGIVCTKSDVRLSQPYATPSERVASLTYLYQDINPVEAERDWQGTREVDRQRSRELRRFKESIAAQQRTCDRLHEEVQAYDDIHDPTESDREAAFGLGRSERQAKYVHPAARTFPTP